METVNPIRIVFIFYYARTNRSIILPTVMNIEPFFQHWSITENPFKAEEAKDDTVFERLIPEGTAHPDFEKIYGQPLYPSSAVVFGEKGSGKTALRLLAENKLRKHNREHLDRMIWSVHYDDFNPIIDRLVHGMRRLKIKESPLKHFRLEDHMDAILSLATTRLTDEMLGERKDPAIPPQKAIKRLRRMSRQKRFDLAELIALYDQPTSGFPDERWTKVRRILKLGRINWLNTSLQTSAIALIVALICGAGIWLLDIVRWEIIAVLGISALLSFFLFISWFAKQAAIRQLIKQIRKEIHVIDWPSHLLRKRLSHLPEEVLNAQPIPVPGDQDSRYQLSARLLAVLRELGFTGITILVDRVDEPALIKGDPEKMKALVWPMLDNKFLQQEHIGIKLLLPIELRHILRREDPDFFQKARLDKQHMIDQLVWSGATLYDLCNRRLQACAAEGNTAATLRDLFEEEVSDQGIIEALDQMHQPRDAFKLMYQVVLEHCLHNAEQSAAWRIPRLTLEHVRRQQSQRVQNLYRGVTPA